MEKRYQVFVSSTYADLKIERTEVIQALLELDCIPSGMELFPASDDTQWDIIKNIVDDCDYYILISAGRYGSTNSEGVSYTEMEYDYAVEKGIPVISFLHSNPEDLPVSKCEKSEMGKQMLEAFKTKAKSKLCKFWGSPAELGSVVSRSLVQLIKRKPGIGWVKADRVPSVKTAGEILRLKEKIEELQNKNVRRPKETDKFQQGEDRVVLNYHFTRKEKRGEEEDHIGYILRPGTSWKGTLPTSWNEIFRSIYPYFTDETSEETIKTAINSFVERLKFQEVKEKYKNDEVSLFRIARDSFHTIIIQLRALQFIEKSERTVKIDDNQTYWKLTEYGDKVLIDLSALKRK